MKKLALTIVCAVAMAGAAFAQGWAQWTIPTGDVTMVTNAINYSPLFGGGTASGPNTGTSGLTATTAQGFYYTLLYQSTPNGLLSSDTTVWDGTWQVAGNGGVAMMGTNSTGLSHGGVAVGAVNGQTLNVQVNWANGITNSVVLVGWSANMGNTWVTVSNELANWSTLGSGIVGNAFFGETSIGNVNPAASSPGNGLFANNSNATATGTPIFSLNTPLYLLPVPEPGTLALAGLGGISLLLFRRRKV